MRKTALAITDAVISMALAASEARSEPAYPYEGPAGLPIAPLRLHGVCPGECCSYGDWVTTGPTTVYVTALDTNDVLVRLLPRTGLVGLHGFIHLTRVGKARAIREVRLDWQGDAAGFSTLPEGGNAIVLDHLGEGFWRVWHEGQIYQLPVEETKASAELPSDDPQKGLWFVLSPRTEWWAEVKLSTPDAGNGWINMNEAPQIEGVDGCGG